MATATHPTQPPKPATPARHAAVRDRRRSTRIPTTTAGRVGNAAVQIFDVSLDGAGFHSTHPFQPGDRHPILIGNGPMYLEGTLRITSVRPKRDGTFDVGGVFI